MTPERKKLLIQILVLVAIFIVLVGAALAAYFTASQPSVITPDTPSTSRLQTLNQVFQSYFGNKWPYVMLSYAVGLIVIIAVLYMMTAKTFTVDISDRKAKFFSITWIIFLVIFTLAMILLSLKTFLSQRQDTSSGYIPNYIPSIDNSSRNKLILAITGVGIFIISLVTILIFYFIHQRGKSKK